MINFTSGRSSTSIEFVNNPRYLNEGTIEVPLNSLALEFDGSGLALFKKAANGDVLFQCFPSETNLATREAIETFYTSYMVGTAGGASYTAGEGINISEANEISVDKEALDIPTPQVSFSGDSTNYVWSLGEYVNNSSNNVVSTVSISPHDDIGPLKVAIKVWGQSTYREIASVPTASSRADGAMSSEDKVKLDALPSEAYSKTEIDSMIGDVESLLAAI